jgi:hypothetical protein
MDSAEIILVSVSYLTYMITVMNIKWMSKFKTKSGLNEYKYEIYIQRI